MHKQKNLSGFTLIELLIVIVIISTLAVAVFVSLNPLQRIQEARDARRISEVNSILTAIHQYIIDTKGTLPGGLSTTEQQLGTGTAIQCSPVSTGGCSVVSGTACLDLTTPLAKYIKSIPKDPKDGTATTTKYAVVVDSNGIITVKACGTEGASPIAVSR